MIERLFPNREGRNALPCLGIDKYKISDILLNMNPSEAMTNAEKWHKENCSEGNIDKVKDLLKKASETFSYPLRIGVTTYTTVRTQVSPIPILHNEGKIYLQFCGWSINLLDDGTWHWEDTTGG